MVRLPSIRELGLWGTVGASEDVAMPDLRRSRTASPSNVDACSPRFIKTEDQDHHASSQLQPAPSLRASHCESASLIRPNLSPLSPTNSDTGSSLSLKNSKAYPSIFALEPRVSTTHNAFEDCSWSTSQRRRDSDDSVAGTVTSTPSLDGSCASFCSSGDEASPALAPSTPRDVSQAPYFRDLSSEWQQQQQQHHLSFQQASDYDHHVISEPFFKDPFYISLPPSSAIPRRALPPPPNRRSANPSSTPRRRSPSSRQPSSPPSSYRIEKPKTQRAKPKNMTGEAHCNEKYTQEENFFLIHHRGDLAMPWKQVERLFDQRFCSGGSGSGTGSGSSGRPYRREGGVQSQYYRLNARCPQMAGADKLLVFGPRPGGVHDRGADRFDENDNLVFECKVRRGIKRSLVERYAEQVVEGRYEWIPEEVMREAERLAALRRPHRLAWEAEKASNPALTELAKDWPVIATKKDDSTIIS
ncbi:hypothetical protein GE09DRAFT_1055459 [Coniochaeta sp. 2T2.1]|nr:hypothetical protein GE09DRAFT_1055459 [Coniochaeta sp. 2T2.1]